jgi:SSS family solute:Na+ symporter/sodium/proline symporter
VFAKVISTANNFLFSPATNLIHDVYERFIDRHASQKRTMIVSRLAVVLLGVVAVLQTSANESVLAASLYAYTIYGAAVTPSVLAVFLWRRATTAGAVSSILLGTAVTIGWQQAHLEIPAIYPALIASLLSLIAVSLATPPPDPRKLVRLEHPNA